MGIFSKLVDTAVSANEEAHGSRLQKEYADSIAKMSVMPREQSDEIIRRFIDKRSKIVLVCWDWTSAGALKMVATIRQEARTVTDMNMTEGYALWMTAAWLESKVRTSANAKKVFSQLDGLAMAHETGDQSYLVRPTIAEEPAPMYPSPPRNPAFAASLNAEKTESKKPITEEKSGPRSSEPSKTHPGYVLLAGLMGVVVCIWVFAIVFPAPKVAQTEANTQQVASPSEKDPRFDYNDAYLEVKKQYPLFDPSSPAYSLEATTKLFAERDRYIKVLGYDQEAALRVALVSYINDNKPASNDKPPMRPRQVKHSRHVDHDQSSSIEPRNCVYKSVMTDQDYRDCGLQPPGAR